MARKYETSKDYPLEKDTLFFLALKALEQCKVQITDKSKFTGEIKGKTKFSMWSVSEIYTITIAEENNKTRLNFKSECAMPSQLVDYGKNKKNAEQFYKILENIIKDEKENLTRPAKTAEQPKTKGNNCPNCKAKLDKDDDFCPQCGRKV